MSKKKILVVEDDMDARNMLTTMLEALGYDTVSYGSGNETLKNVDSLKVDLAMLDIMMPGMNGYELLEQLRQHPGLERLPVIMVSAKDADTDIIAGYQEGIDYYITKPYTTTQLKYGISLVFDSAGAKQEE